MTLRPGKKDAYFASHNEGFWPEMGAMLKEHGAHNYCIHLLEDPAGSGGGTLIFYVEIESEEKWAVVKDTEICKKWWKWMEGECAGAGPTKFSISQRESSTHPRLATPTSSLLRPAEFIVFNADGTPAAKPGAEMFFLP